MKKIALTISVIIFSVPLVAQQQTLPESLLPGNRVRVTAPQFFQKIKISKSSRKIERVVGTVMATNAYVLFLKVDNQPEPLIISVPFASLRKLEVSRGNKSKIGAGVGFLAGAPLFYYARGKRNDFARMDAALVWAGYGAILGIFIGASIGSSISDDRWVEVALPIIPQQQTLPESLILGNRVRVTAHQFFQKIKINKPSRRQFRVVGTVTAVNNDTLFLKVDKQVKPLKVPRSSLKKIEVSLGKKSRVVKGALIGFVIGLATAEAVCANSRFEDSGTMGPKKWACGLLIGGPAGGLIGAAVGDAIKERWEEVPLNSAFKANQN